MSPLRHELIECCDSLSCLHTVEHIGLGRYGDPVNCDGHLVGPLIDKEVSNNFGCGIFEMTKQFEPDTLTPSQ